MIGQSWKMLQRAADKIGDEVNPVLGSLDRASCLAQRGLRQIQRLMASFDYPLITMSKLLMTVCIDYGLSAPSIIAIIDDLAAG